MDYVEGVGGLWVSCGSLWVGSHLTDYPVVPQKSQVIPMNTIVKSLSPESFVYEQYCLMNVQAHLPRE